MPKSSRSKQKKNREVKIVASSQSSDTSGKSTKSNRSARKKTDPHEPRLPPPYNRFIRPNMERVEMLARPHSRRLRSLWEEKCTTLPKERRDKIKSALEEDYFLSPEQTELYFQALQQQGGGIWSGIGGMMCTDRKEKKDREREYRQRHKWLVDFSAQVAYSLCDYLAKGQKEMLVSNRLRSIADVVLERVAEILGEPKPSRNNPGRLARFMVAISDRIAVWIENAVYRAEEPEPCEYGPDEHIQLDTDKPIIC